MRVRGDSEQCAAAARALGRAAAAVADAAGQLRDAQGSWTTWSGSAQDRWAALAMRQSIAGNDVAQRLGLVARALTRHAVLLTELQARASRLVQEAAEARLHLDEDGWMAPVPLLTGPGTTPDHELLRQVLAHQWEAREDLLRRVAALRAEEASMHEQLVRALRTLNEPSAAPPALLPSGSPSVWAPTWWDVPPTALGAASAGAGALPPSALQPGALGRAAGPVLVLRNVPLVGIASTGYGVYVDTHVNGMGTRDAVEKNVVVTVVGTGVTVTVTAVATTVGAPATAVVVVAVGTGALAGFGIGKVWDAVSGSGPKGTVPHPPGVQPTPSPADPRPGATAPRPTAPRPTAPTTTAPTTTAPRPSPGPPPQAPSSVHSLPGRPSRTAISTAPSP